MHVRNLSDHGQLRVAIRHEGTVYHAVVVKDERGVTGRIRGINAAGYGAKYPCDLGVWWSARRDFIKVRTPINLCIGGGDQNRTMGIRLIVDGARDTVGRVPFRAPTASESAS